MDWENAVGGELFEKRIIATRLCTGPRSLIIRFMARAELKSFCWIIMEEVGRTTPLPELQVLPEHADTKEILDTLVASEIFCEGRTVSMPNCHCSIADRSSSASEVNG